MGAGVACDPHDGCGALREMHGELQGSVRVAQQSADTANSAANTAHRRIDWLMGISISTLVAALGSLLAILFK